jgi:ubiquinone/menaquinone biosynthesis C-methylase UbiE
MNQNTDVINQWSESAPYWDKHRGFLCEMFAPVTQALIEDAQIAGPLTVLDVATGPGEPALSIAALIGPEGKVLGTDAVPEMVEAARREARRQSLPNAIFEVCSAESLPFGTNSFDAVVSRFGVMFFPSPIDSIRDWLRVLKPGGRIALAVWHFADKNPFHFVVTQVVQKYVPSAPPLPDAPDTFRFAPPCKLHAVLSQAGVAAISERLLQFPIRASMSAEDFWTLRREMSEKLRTKIAKLSEHEFAQLTSDVVDALRPYCSGGVISFPAEVLILSGRKPS